MDWSGKNVFITGATGFVGSWVTRALLEKGANVTVLVRDDMTTSNLKKLGLEENLRALMHGDLTDYALVERIFNEFEIEYAFHIAAQAIVGIANRSPLSTFESNIKGTWTILENARNSKTLKGLVVASTDKVYGEPKSLPITEDHPLLASYPYDASKACADILSRMYFKTYGVPVAVTRCCNIYGGGDMNFSRIIPDAVRSAINNSRPIIRSDGTPVRDFVYISDVVNAYLMLAENISNPNVKGEAFNFGSNSPISILELVKKIIFVSGRNLEPDIQGISKPHAEIDRQYLSNEKAKKILGWSPKVSLDEGLKLTYEWYEKFLRKN